MSLCLYNYTYAITTISIALSDYIYAKHISEILRNYFPQPAKIIKQGSLQIY